jgi:hypothetical protein
VTLRFNDSAPPMKIASVEAICNGRRQSLSVQGDYYAYWSKVYGNAEILDGRFFQATFIAPVTAQDGANVPDHHLMITCDRHVTKVSVETITRPPSN